MTTVFTEDNTKWEYDGCSHRLVYDGDLAELAEETKLSEERLMELLEEYECESRDSIDYQREIARAKEGRY